MKFTAKGHKNILATHKTTLEFTKDSEIKIEGDCIVGVSADFDLKDVKELTRKGGKVKIIIQVDELKEEINGELNPNFSDEKEIVIRMGSFASDRTLVVNADKSAKYLSRDFLRKLKNPETIISIEIEYVY